MKLSFAALHPIMRQAIGATIGMSVAVGIYALGKLLPFDVTIPLPGDNSAAHAAWEPKTFDDIAEMAKESLNAQTITAQE